MPERKLSWQPGFSLYRKPAKRPAPRRNQHHRFEIVVENPQDRSYHYARDSPSTRLPARPPLPPPLPSDASTEHNTTTKPLRGTEFQIETFEAIPRTEDGEGNASHTSGRSLVISDEEAASSSSSSHEEEASSDPETIDTPTEPQPSSSPNDGDEDQFTTSALSPEPLVDEFLGDNSDANATVLNSATAGLFSDSLLPESTIIPLTIEYGSLMERFRPVLTRCMCFSLLSQALITLFPPYLLMLRLTYFRNIFHRQHGILHDPVDVSAAH